MLNEPIDFILNIPRKEKEETLDESVEQKGEE